MKKLRWFVLGLFTLAVFGCGGSSGGNNPWDDAGITPIGRIEGYVLNADFGGGVGVYRVNGTTGGLTEVAGSPFVSAGTPQAFAVAPGGRHIYAPSRGGTLLEGFAMDPPTGALSALPGFPMNSVPDGYPSLSPTGEYLYVSGESDVDGFRVDGSNGALTRLSGFPISVNGMTNAQTQKFSPNGRFLYVVDKDTDQVFIFTHNAATGALGVLGQVFSGGAEPTTVGIEPGGNFLYVAHADGTLVGFGIASNGGLVQLAGPATVYSNSPSVTYRMDFINDVVYLGNGADGSLNAFRVTASGILNAISGFPRAGGGASALIFPFPFAPYLYTSDRSNNRIFGYLPTATGAANPIPGSPYTANGQPSSLEGVVVGF